MYLFWVLLSLLLIAKTASALGLGEIRVKAAFNNGFAAEVPVLWERAEGPISAQIGSTKDYKTLELKKPDFIDTLQITIVPDLSRGPDEQLLLITSTKPIQHPSFNLVIRASAGGGTIMESFFMVMDFKKSLSLGLPDNEDIEEVIIKPQIARKPEVSNKETGPIVEDKAKEMNQLSSIKQSLEPELPKTAMKLAETAIETPTPPVKPKADKEEPPLKETVEHLIETKKQLEAKKARENLPVESDSLIEPLVLVVTQRPPAPEVELKDSEFYVRQGDYLYKIAKKLGVFKKHYEKAILSLFENNKKAFINSNINLIKVGAILDTSSIRDMIGQKDIAEFFITPDIISTNFRKNKGLVEFDLPVTEHVASEDIYSFLGKWKDHWVSKDKAAIADDYDENFIDPKGRKRSTFLRSRYAFNRNQKNIRIMLENVSIVRSGSFVSIYFTQRFQSKRFSSVGLKRIKIRESDTGLKIISEQFIPNRVAGGSHPWIVYLAYSKHFKVSKKNIQTLRDAGYQAFEAETYRNLGSNGYRILVGRTSTKMLANRLANQLKNDGNLFAKILKLPFALKAVTDGTKEATEKTFEKLLEKGYSPYLLETMDNEKPAYRVYIGAFENREKAGYALKKLKDYDFEFRIATP